MSLSLVGLTIVWVFILLSVLVVIHEFGHFIAAKLMGIHVLEFGLGYPPRVKKLFRWWQTDFTFNTLPFGGFVRLYGDDGETVEQGSEADSEVTKNVGDQQKFNRQAKWKRLIVISAGVIFNFIFGAAIFAFIYSVKGIPAPAGEVSVSQVNDGSPAMEAGLKEGDVLLKLENQTSIEPQTAQAVIDFVVEHRGDNINITWEHEGETQNSEVYLRTTEETPENNGSLGVVLSDTTIKFYPWYEMPWRGVVVGVKDAMWVSQMIVEALSKMVVELFSKGQVPQEVSGIVGIVDQAVEVEAVKQGWAGTLHTTAVLSINLAIMNILPIPMLDGGRAVFIVLESFIGPKKRQRWEQKANTLGFIFLISLIVLITIKDVIGLFV